MGTSVSPGHGGALTSSGGLEGERRGRIAGLPSPTAPEIVLGLTVLGAALRFATLDVQSLNVDEADTVILIHRTFTGMLSHITNTESSPPLYYILAWAWSRVFGMGTVGLRSFSALVGALTIPVMYLAGRQISPRVGVWAAALTTVSSSMYFYSQETRCYPLLVLFSAAAYIYWRSALENPTVRALGLWAGMGSLALLTHYFAAFLLIPEAIILARRIGLKRVWAPVAAIGVVGLALVPLAISERSDGKTNWIEELSLSGRIAETVKVLTTGKYVLLVLPVVALILLLSAGAVALVFRRGDVRDRGAARDAMIVASAALAVPLVLAVSHIIDVFDGTNMVAVWVPLTLLVSYGLGLVRARLSGALIGAAICAISVAAVATTDALPVYQRDDWRGVARALGQPASPRIIVIVSRNVDALAVYLGDLRTIYSPTVTAHEVDFAALRTRRTVAGPLPPVVPTTPPEGFRFAGLTRTKTYAISRFLAVGSGTVTLANLRKVKAEPAAEVILQR
jgi:mannosyltransferase